MVFIIIFLIFRMVSPGSMLAGLSLPVLVYLLTDHPMQLMIFSIAITFTVLITHRKNIGRLVRGEESRIALRGRGRD